MCLEEENVFRAVLEWSKNQAGVTQPVAHWNDEERHRVCKYLSPIIHHVRILLIDSQVFAEEIEPTGAGKFNFFNAHVDSNIYFFNSPNGTCA